MMDLLKVFIGCAALSLFTMALIPKDSNVLIVPTLHSLQPNDGDYHFAGAGIKKSITMNGGVLHIEGASCEIKVKGFAEKVIIEGAGTNVYVDKVNRVKIAGADSHVYYKESGARSGTPSAEIFGAGSGMKRVK